MHPIEGKTVLVTGASSGIGAALARLLARRGARLALAARRKDRLESLAAELGGDVLVLPADVRRREDVEAAVRGTVERFGRLDVLVANAGVLRMEPFLRMPEEDMRDVFETNFWSVVHGIRAAAPVMARQGGGHIVAVGSGVSRRGLPFMAAYAAGKFALAGLMESARMELQSRGIAFTTVYPGGVETEMPASVDPAKLPRSYPRHAGMRIPAERAARAVLGAIRRRPLEVYVPWWVRYASWLSVVAPGAADFLIRRSYKESLWKEPSEY